MQLFIADIRSEHEAVLREEEARHCIKVLRHQPGDRIHCVDGLGTYYATRLVQGTPGEVLLQIESRTHDWGEHPGSICLAVSPLRLRDRFEWLVEKAVELGVTEIMPFTSQHTDKYQSRYKEERLLTLMRTALKQSLRARLPVLHPLRDLADCLATHRDGLRLIAHAAAPQHLDNLHDTTAAADQITLYIGPEGDFGASEYEMAQAQGLVPVHLGATRLRSETAALFGLSLLKAARGY
ncbi:MAG: 16S rRNA (uracil(1498)-N(3))-methyltransferase [Bacteroidia bacterium]